MMRFFLGVLAYVVPTFALGFVWHLILFEHTTQRLRSIGATSSFLSVSSRC
jgi:hypothetical protein